MPRSLGESVVNLEGNKKIRERTCFIRSLWGKVHNANKKTSKQHTLSMTK